MESDYTRVDLHGALEGRHILVDTDAFTLGHAEDLQSGQIAKILDVLAELVRGGSLPKGYDRAGLRALKVKETQALVEGVTSVLDVTKS